MYENNFQSRAIFQCTQFSVNLHRCVQCTPMMGAFFKYISLLGIDEIL